MPAPLHDTIENALRNRTGAQLGVHRTPLDCTSILSISVPSTQNENRAYTQAPDQTHSLTSALKHPNSLKGILDGLYIMSTLAHITHISYHLFDG